ncbi:MAG: bifunctional phosphoribosylaminoimidazolecarboxamide formyltransferase/IMP cyclohydrolase [Pseudomonadota bacterium]
MSVENASPTVRRALVSVSNKSGLVDLCEVLVGFGIDIISTGGTANALRTADVPVTDVSQVTGFPEIMDGRVKTLHPNIHAGLLALRSNDKHLDALDEHQIAPIDLLVVNLYPFEQTLASGANLSDLIENIDIGGPAMIRAASKNYADIAVLTDPSDYAELIEELRHLKGATSASFRERLAAKAFARTASYDAAVAGWMGGRIGEELPDRFTVSGKKITALRYGENPHQQAALYEEPSFGEGSSTIVNADLVQGKPLSYNNINDASAAFKLVSSLSPDAGPAVAIIKHANPCGVAQAETLEDAYKLALRCDPVSAFGGIIATNVPLSEAAASQMVEIFTEVIVTPAADVDARAILSKKKNLRLMVTGGLAEPDQGRLLLQPVSGGFLVQSEDALGVREQDLKVVTKRSPSPDELADLKFAFQVTKFVKSNAIVYAKGGATVGIGAGQMNRRDSSRIAAHKAAEAAELAGLESSLAEGSVVASDAFFPFPDGLLAAAEAGATAVIQPGGSVRDKDVIAAADEAGLAMVFTGVRHFLH